MVGFQVYRPALGPTQPLSQRLLWAPSVGVKGQRHGAVHCLPFSAKIGAVPLLPNMSSQPVQGQLYRLPYETDINEGLERL